MDSILFSVCQWRFYFLWEEERKARQDKFVSRAQVQTQPINNTICNKHFGWMQLPRLSVDWRWMIIEVVIGSPKTCGLTKIMIKLIAWYYVHSTQKIVLIKKKSTQKIVNFHELYRFRTTWIRVVALTYSGWEAFFIFG